MKSCRGNLVTPQCHENAQVELYVPEEAHPAFGIVRAVVMDGTDGDMGAASQVRNTSQPALIHPRCTKRFGACQAG